MADSLPAALAIPEVSRFVKRANQLRTIKPAIAYWCEYHAVNQIVAKALHTGDDAAFDFTKTLIDRLESTKTERPDDDAIMDNAAGQAYVEQFAQETFDRAERALRANKVTRQTADTFDAAATFFDLGTEWGPLEPDVSQKIKFAKWNAARILRAIREGKDPNESNPKMDKEEETETGATELGMDPSDPEVQQLTSASPKPAAVEDVADAGEPIGGLANEPSPDISVPAQEGYFPPAPMNAPDAFSPSPLSQSPAAPSQHLPADISAAASPYQQPQPPPAVPTQTIPIDTPPIPSSRNEPSAPPSWTTTPSAAPVPPPVAPQPVVPAWSPTPTPQPPQSQYAPPPPASSAAPSQRDIDRAQKHAKFAVSALNFDDVTTAVNELRTALAALNAQ